MAWRSRLGGVRRLMREERKEKERNAWLLVAKGRPARLQASPPA